MIATVGDDTRYITTEDMVSQTSSGGVPSSGPSISSGSFEEDFEWEEHEVNYKGKKLFLSVPKGSLDFDPSKRIPLYSPAIRVNNGRRR